MGLNSFQPEHMGMAIVPRPFPGKYPTRILMKWGDDLTYLGKPVDAAFKRIEKEFFGKGGEPRYVDIFEFDLSGLIFLKVAGIISIAGLAPFYFSFPNNRFLERLSHFGRYWFLRDRQLSKSGGHGVYLSNMFLSSPYRLIYLEQVVENANGVIPGRPFPPRENIERWADEYLQPFWRRHIEDREIIRRAAPAPVAVGGRRRTLTFNVPRLDFTPPPAETTTAQEGAVHYNFDWVTQPPQRRAEEVPPPIEADVANPWLDLDADHIQQFAQQLAGAQQAPPPEPPQAINPLGIPLEVIRQLEELRAGYPGGNTFQVEGRFYRFDPYNLRWRPL